MDDKPKHMRPGNHQKPLELLLYFYADEKLCADNRLEEYIPPLPPKIWTELWSTFVVPCTATWPSKQRHCVKVVKRCTFRCWNLRLDTTQLQGSISISNAKLWCNPWQYLEISWMDKYLDFYFNINATIDLSKKEAKKLHTNQKSILKYFHTQWSPPPSSPEPYETEISGSV